ncbi:MAG: phytanoyl-CoA dioxygenase family protein [Phycisphaeraceae bacterium]
MSQAKHQSIFGDAEEVEVKPAAGVWDGRMPESLDEQVEFFKREGFLVLRNVLDRDDLEELDRALQDIIDRRESLTPVREGFDLEKKQDPTTGRPAFRKIGGITAYSDAFDKLMRHPRILDRLHPIMGDTIQLWRDVCMMKPARVGREKPWHQDSSYWPWEPMSLVSAMTALDDATPENGCLQVIPRTHHDVMQHFGKELQVEIDGELQARTLYVPLKAGDTLLFHSLLLHASEPNRSDRNRRVCIISYKTPYTEYIGKGEPRECPLVSERKA